MENEKLFFLIPIFQILEMVLSESIMQKVIVMLVKLNKCRDV